MVCIIVYIKSVQEKNIQYIDNTSVLILYHNHYHKTMKLKIVHISSKKKFLMGFAFIQIDILHNSANFQVILPIQSSAVQRERPNIHTYIHTFCVIEVIFS